MHWTWHSPPRRRIALVISALLICAQVETNPGPITRGNGGDASILAEINEKLSKMDTLDAKLDRLCNDVSSIRSWQTEIDGKIELMNQENAQLNEAVSKLVEQNEALTKTNKQMQEKLLDQEARSRQQNLIFHGMKKNGKKETWEQSELAVRKLMKDKLKLDSDNIEIHRAHRLGADSIIVNFLKYKDREEVLKRKKQLEGTQMYITEDHPPEIRQIRKKLMNLAERQKKEGDSVFLRYNKVVIGGIAYKLSGGGDNLVPMRGSNSPGHQNGASGGSHD